MPPIARILLVVVVVSSGTAVAMMFRRHDVPADAQQVTPANNLALQSDTPRVVTDQTRLEQPPLREGEEDRRLAPSQGRSSNGTTDPTSSGQRFFMGNRGLPPHFTPISPLRPRIKMRGNPLRDPGPRQEVPLRDPSQPTVRVPTSLREHKIVDGDTLTNLAQQYLGDHRRYAEIYEMNRDVLPGPNVLPIGSMLRIPPRQSTPGPVVGGKVTSGQTPSRLHAITPGTVRPAQ